MMRSVRRRLMGYRPRTGAGCHPGQSTSEWAMLALVCLLLLVLALPHLVAAYHRLSAEYGVVTITAGVLAVGLLLVVVPLAPALVGGVARLTRRCLSGCGGSLLVH